MKRVANGQQMVPLQMSEIDRYETQFGPMFHYADDEVIGRSLRQYGQWAIDEIALITHLMRRERQGDFIDIGANVGSHTVAIGTLFPAAEVFAFEANPRTHQLLCTNVTANGLTNVTAFNYLVGDVSTMSRVVSKIGGIGKNLGAVGFQMAPLETSTGQLTLQIKVDDVVPPPCKVAFVKADVEGMEYKALRGARATLERCHPAIYFENGVQTDAGPLFDDLETLGYETFWHINFPFDEKNYLGEACNFFGGAVEIGTLCIHRSSKAIHDVRESLTATSRQIDANAWEQCVALNAKLRDELRATLNQGKATAWLRGELLKRRSAAHDAVAAALQSGTQSMPTFAEIRRATLLDLPSHVLRPLLEPYIATAPLNEEAYLQRYPDVAEAVATQRFKSAREHYVIAGYFEGRAG